MDSVNFPQVESVLHDGNWWAIFLPLSRKLYPGAFPSYFLPGLLRKGRKRRGGGHLADSKGHPATNWQVLWHTSFYSACESSPITPTVPLTPTKDSTSPHNAILFICPRSSVLQHLGPPDQLFSKNFCRKLSDCNKIELLSRLLWLNRNTIYYKDGGDFFFPWTSHSGTFIP